MRDEAFRNSVMNPNLESSRFWNEWPARHPSALWFLVRPPPAQDSPLPFADDLETLAHSPSTQRRRPCLDERAVFVPASELALARLVLPSRDEDNQQTAHKNSDHDDHAQHGDSTR